MPRSNPPRGPRGWVASRRPGLWLAFALVACTVAADLDGLEDGMCDDGYKACDGTCVPTDNPNFGCESPSCTPCAIPNATAVCSLAGECTVAVCDPNFADCTPDDDMGCLVDLAHDTLNCGACGNVCALDRAQPVCANRRCSVGACETGWGDCDDEDVNGCETDLASTDAHCGACDAPCLETEQCIESVCTG